MNIKKCPCHAYIINSFYQENIGRVVEVFQRAEDINCQVMWFIRVSKEGPPLRVNKKIEFEFLAGLTGRMWEPSTAYECQSPDFALKPIDGVDLDDEKETEEQKTIHEEWCNYDGVQ